jgi:hypothetical protein
LTNKFELGQTSNAQIQAQAPFGAQQMCNLNLADCDAGTEGIEEEESPADQVAGVNKPVCIETVETNSNSEATQPGAISKPSEKPPENPRPGYELCYVGPHEWNDVYVDPSFPGIPRNWDDD